MTVETVLPHGLKTSVFGSQWNVEHGANLALLDPDRIKSDTLVNRPAFGAAHCFFFATDNRRLYYDTGTAWVDITAVALTHASTHGSGGADAITPAAIGAEASANKGLSGGYAPLDSNSKVPLANIPATALPVSDAMQTALNGKVGTAGNESIAGVKTFTDSVFVGTAVKRIKGYFGLLDWMGFVAQIGTITVGTAPYGVAYCPTNDRIYVANSTAGTVSVIIPSSNTVAATITVGTNPYDIAYCPTNDRIYVANYGAGTVSVIVPSSNTVAATITVGTSPIGVAYCPTNDRIYVGNYTAGTVSVIVPSSNTVAATITVGTAPHGVAYCPTNDRIYVANSTAGTVSVITPSSNTVAATITVGTSPIGVAYCPTNDRIYVGNYGAGTVSILT